MKILVTGTPGVGKTTLSKQIAQITGIEHIEITNFIKNNKLYESYNKEFDTLIFDEDFVADKLKDYVEHKESFVIDTHSPIVAENIEFDYIFHLVCETKIIYDRLALRGYSVHKINENIESEIFNVIGEEINEIFDCDNYRVNCSDSPMEDTDIDLKDVIEMITKT